MPDSLLPRLSAANRTLAAFVATLCFVSGSAPGRAERADAIDAAGTQSCDPGGLAPLLTPGRILLLGELHGTEEGPALVAEIACAALDRALAVAVALEIPVEESDRLGQFLASDGAAEATARLLGGEFWQRTYQDGRSSRAMLGLLDALRRLALARGHLSVTLLDSTRNFASGQERDDEMAQRLVALVAGATPATVVVSLTGNIHDRTAPGTPWDAAYRPMGIAVASRWPERTLSVLLANPPGTAWTCPDSDAAHCGEGKFGGSGDAEGGRLEIFAAPRDGHGARFHLSGLTASPPAVGGR